MADPHPEFNPFALHRFEQVRRRYWGQRGHVSGGRVDHIFLDGADIPACGIRPMRGDRPARWTLKSGPQWRARRLHWRCEQALYAHRRRMVEGIR